ncbi:MAG TPA: hypothetical protein VJ953_05395 [Saprospiraceae bacterium]|nr:hypothetical protein [Saprospiraceae bacterium]
MKTRIYLFSLCLLFGALLTCSSCSPKSGCPALGTSATQKERKKGGDSNLFSKKTRRKVNRHE